jgi:hypothetical protein
LRIKRKTKKKKKKKKSISQAFSPHPNPWPPSTTHLVVADPAGDLWRAAPRVVDLAHPARAVALAERVVAEPRHVDLLHLAAHALNPRVLPQKVRRRLHRKLLDGAEGQHTRKVVQRVLAGVGRHDLGVVAGPGRAEQKKIKKNQKKKKKR